MKSAVRFGLFIEYIFGNTSAKITIKVVINIVAYRIPDTPNKSQRKTVAREDAKIFTRLFDNNNEEIIFSLLLIRFFTYVARLFP